LVIILAVGIMLAMVHPVVCVIGTSFAVLATYWIGLLASVSIVNGSVLTGIVIALTALIVWKMK
jgi:cobalamin biosynthesis protein CobD/CbiB